MCDFKPGDEVTPVPQVWTATDKVLVAEIGVHMDGVYTVDRVWIDDDDDLVLTLVGISNANGGRFLCEGFRKVQRKSTETGMEMLRKAADDAGALVTEWEAV